MVPPLPHYPVDFSISMATRSRPVIQLSIYDQAEDTDSLAELPQAGSRTPNPSGTGQTSDSESSLSIASEYNEREYGGRRTRRRRSSLSSTSSLAMNNPNNSITENIKLIVRLRPMSFDESSRGDESAWDTDGEMIWCDSSFVDDDDDGESKQFTFDYVADEAVTTAEIYESHVKTIVDSFLQGCNATLLAYGQTSSGKSMLLFHYLFALF